MAEGSGKTRTSADGTVGVSIATEQLQMMEEANLKASYSPGRPGGTFALPLGAKLVVPEGVCGKRDNFVCQVAPPGQRWRHSALFRGEHVTSEIFTLAGNVTLKQRTVVLVLPYRTPPDDQMEINVKGLWKDEAVWTDVGFINKIETPLPCVELEIDRLGTFLVTFRPKSDVFQITPLGGLYHSRLNRNITFRLPKKAVATPVTFTLQIEPVPEERVALCREYFAQACQDLHSTSAMFHFNPDTTVNFKRAATIKLPLPNGLEVEGEKSEEVVVLHQEGEKRGWEVVEGTYKFSRNTVTFDVKNPNTLVVVRTLRQERKRKMVEAMGVVAERVGRELGEVTAFLSLQSKVWRLLLEVYPLSEAAVRLQRRQQQGFVPVARYRQPSPAPNAPFSRRLTPPSQPRVKAMECLELHDGLTWSIEVTDDLKVTADSDLRENTELTVFRYLEDNYRWFHVEPAVEEERPLRGTVLLLPTFNSNPPDPATKESLALTFFLDIPYDAVRRFWYVPEPAPEPEPVKKKSALPLLSEPLPPSVPTSTPAPRPRVFSISAMERLTQPLRKPQVPDKEAKVLSGRSLMALSKVITEALTLAVNLGLPDSTITGIGFDALSSGRDMTEVGYRILLHWKRLQRDKREGAVVSLVAGLRSMGKDGVANVILEQHRLNRELTVDCFLAAAVSGINIA